jgi:DNA-directed RNA polymerase specialized sigma24 family protein
MDDTSYREFFSTPTNPYHRRYEALRAVFVEGRSQKEVAKQFGYEYSTMRQLVYEFRQHCRNSGDASPFFET